MFEPFAHFLAYGATDQRTLREVTKGYQGIVVPGTIAAFQSEGTRGFVLSLSAAERFPYVIDPRTPLFQSYIDVPKKSHIALARILGLDAVADSHGVVLPSAWDSEIVENVSNRWLEFNRTYLTLQPKAFDKYARRLKKSLPQVDAEGPSWIIPPYLTETSDYPGARDISEALWTSALVAATEGGYQSQLRRVISVVNPGELSNAALSTSEEEVIVWVSNLEETNLSNFELLSSYARSIREVALAGRKPFALYGGYFAVTLRSLGLVGASHGVGFSEHRNHVELKSTGAAPARYYVERAHKFFPVDLASELWRREPGVVAAGYAGYTSIDPQELEYHDLMMHSVRARQHEIAITSGMTLSEHASDLAVAHMGLQQELSRVRLTEGLRRQVNSNLAHMQMWSGVLTEVADL